MPLIMPIKELRNTTEISNIAHKEQEPIFITKNGYSDLVVMSSELYDQFARINRIDQAILNLNTFPHSHQKRNEGSYAGKGYHQLLIDNYIAIFRVDETNKIVYVVTVQYQGRNL